MQMMKAIFTDPGSENGLVLDEIERKFAGKAVLWVNPPE
jgi:hypothetical protein